MSETWFTADTHFGHARINEYCNRPFKDAKEMDECLIENWNSRVKSTDWVYHLGDFCFPKYADPEEYLKKLNGAKILIYGNHDTWETRRQSVWGHCYDMYEVTWQLDEGTKLMASCFHYPIARWNKREGGAFQLHGHTHGVYDKPGEAQMDVGVDAVAMRHAYKPEFYAPINRDEIAPIIWRKLTLAGRK